MQDKELMLNKNIDKIEISGIRKFFNLVSESEDVLSLTIGQPDFFTPDIVKQKAIAAIENNQTTYTPNQGLFELREKVATYLNDWNQTAIKTEEVLITVGASQAIDIVCRTILNPNDEVIIPSPVYPGYGPLITLQGAKIIEVDTTSTKFKLTPDQLKASISDQTKAVILPYPSNPTGVTYTESELKALAKIIKAYNLFIVTDEIYSTLSFDAPHYSMARFTELKDQLITINGLSKSHAMTGWRIGFLIGPERLMHSFTKVLQYNVSCASSISQYAALSAVTDAKDAPIAMKEAYQLRRDYVTERLENMGIDVVVPGGAFYFMFSVPGYTNSFELALDLVNKAKVAFVPGSSFGEAGEGYLRLSYAYSLETLTEGLNRLEHYLKENVLTR